METHMYILKQLLMYSYKRLGWMSTVNDIRAENRVGRIEIRDSINWYLKQK
jgi:hypothetical protein